MGNDQVQFAKIQRSVFADWPCLGVLQVVAVVRKVTMEAASWNTAKFARSSNYNQRGRAASLEERSTITYTPTHVAVSPPPALFSPSSVSEYTE